MKLKINSKVVPSKKCLRFYKNVGLSIYQVPSSGDIRPKDIPSIAYWRAAQLGYLGKGVVVKVKDDFREYGGKLYLVEFMSKFGVTMAWYDRKDLVRTYGRKSRK
jgi:hypothetical protein